MKTFIVLLLLCSSAQADEWSRVDTYREITYQTLAAVDWLQTRQISKICHTPINTVAINGKLYVDGNDYQKHKHVTEMNPILGNCPSEDIVNVYFLITNITHYYIAKTLPEKYRVAFQYISIGFEGGVVAHNFAIGISAKF
jgi:hypothetical protein